MTKPPKINTYKAALEHLNTTFRKYTQAIEITRLHFPLLQEEMQVGRATAERTHEFLCLAIVNKSGSLYPPKIISVKEIKRDEQS